MPGIFLPKMFYGSKKSPLNRCRVCPSKCFYCLPEINFRSKKSFWILSFCTQVLPNSQSFWKYSPIHTVASSSIPFTVWFSANTNPYFWWVTVHGCLVTDIRKTRHFLLLYDIFFLCRNMLQGPWKEAGAPEITLHIDDENVNGEAVGIISICSNDKCYFLKDKGSSARQSFVWRNIIYIVPMILIAFMCFTLLMHCLLSFATKFLYMQLDLATFFPYVTFQVIIEAIEKDEFILMNVTRRWLFTTTKKEEERVYNNMCFFSLL